MTYKQHKNIIISHFAQRMLERYGLIDHPVTLNRLFKSFVVSGKAVLCNIDKRDKNKGFYVVNWRDKRIVFVFNKKLGLAKTAI